MLKKIIFTIKKILRPYYYSLIKILRSRHVYNETIKLNGIKKDNKTRIFYLGITEHSNLGDMAQYYCISNWLDQNYPNNIIFKFEATTVVDQRYNFINILKEKLNSNDIIFFQSGYTTQDLGGCHELMHRLVIDSMPDAKIVMMPQTIFFRSEENKRRTAESYNKAKHLLFLARDQVSFKMAQEMFPKITVKCYPDIVTSLIGKYNIISNKENILLCLRKDNEKFYSEKELSVLKNKFKKIIKVDTKDTTIRVNYKKIRKNIHFLIEKEIKFYSKYKVIVTDRYHGTIFSLIANTPVIVLKTTDHKVVTGVDWFKGVYDDYVHLADSLEDAYKLVVNVLQNSKQRRLPSYFNEKYYLTLKKLIDSTIENGDL